jgi:hypothetical protein
MRLKTFIWILMVGLLLAPSLLPAQPPQAPPPQAEKAATAAPQAEKATAPEPDPRQILQKMCDFLKSQQQFTYKAEVADDQVYAGGQKLQFAIDMETSVRRPDRLRVTPRRPVDKQFYFDGRPSPCMTKMKRLWHPGGPPGYRKRPGQGQQRIWGSGGFDRPGQPTCASIGKKLASLYEGWSGGSLAITCPSTARASSYRCGSMPGTSPCPGRP